ncbi:DapH/DapD/GlmU-related protein [Winogradskyella thalassocola]|uniref:Serine acetyltransferase n=1 Tax=Winogradskyella thalassocola TaxID=262004 RepID=A0A1G8FZK9_9FLAO|nr:DapH/DapD/GlmU-related protein [Winogradskyella thalassocola]SDH87554.1 serine O-acetyltransferase [Winogradskyella thalassocola]
MSHQCTYFKADVKRMLGKHKIRILHIWLSRSFIGVFLYRMERGLYLALGKSYRIVRILFLPFILPMQSYSNIDIHYKAAIKGGLLILHPSVGCVISGAADIGKNLTLVGGNVIGLKEDASNNKFRIGDNCSLGANATILGPIELGDYIKIGASACVIHDFLENNSTLIGVPAKQLNNNK